jgi:hypothetical protein
MPIPFRTRAWLAGLVLAAATPPTARSQDAGPLVLRLPASGRTASLGNAWVAGRDEYVIFHNPALVNNATGFGISTALYARDARAVAFADAETVGPYTIGWGVHFVSFSTSRTNAEYPLAPAVLTDHGDADLSSLVAVVSGQRTYKGFRLGASAKYAEDIVPREAFSSGLLVTPQRGAAFLADIGASHPLWTGTAGFAFQNIGHPYKLGADRFQVPTQASLGWTKQQQVGPFDVGYATQVTMRREGWVGPAGGVEVSWNWIEGYTVAGRIGARRTETDDERPVGFGASITADRLNIDYGVTLFAGNTAAHYVTLRWR